MFESKKLNCFFLSISIKLRILFLIVLDDLYFYQIWKLFIFYFLWNRYNTSGFSENKKNLEGSKVLVVVAGAAEGMVMGGEFEFRFVGWSLEKSFIFVSCPLKELMHIEHLRPVTEALIHTRFYYLNKREINWCVHTCLVGMYVWEALCVTNEKCWTAGGGKWTVTLNFLSWFQILVELSVWGNVARIYFPELKRYPEMYNKFYVDRTTVIFRF